MQLSKVMSPAVMPHVSPSPAFMDLSPFTSAYSNGTWEATTNKTLVRPFSDVDIVISAVIILTLMVVSLVGNVITIVVIVTNPKLKNMFMIFILSLCVSDLYSSLISWIFLYRRTWGFDVWDPMPRIFCKLYWASELWTNYVTAWHILAFGILRYLCCRFPFYFSKILQEELKHAKILIVLIWIISFLVGFVPFYIFFGVREVTRFTGKPSDFWPACTIADEWSLLKPMLILLWYHQEVLYHSICYPLFFYTPIICMIIVAILLCVTLWQNAKKSRRCGSQKTSKKKLRREQQAIFQVLLIVVSYLIGYIPFTAYGWYTVQQREDRTLSDRQFDYWFGMTQYFFLCFSECLNPVFYNLGSSKMRYYTKKLLRQTFCCCLPEDRFVPEHSDTTPSPQAVPARKSTKVYNVTGVV